MQMIFKGVLHIEQINKHNHENTRKKEITLDEQMMRSMKDLSLKKNKKEEESKMVDC
jgi:hypothetical protein